MRRLRIRRRRAAALALIPIAALTTTAAAQAPTDAAKARIDTSAKIVQHGNKVTLRGKFPGASRAPIELRHRSKGSAWQTRKRSRTDAKGRYKVRAAPRVTGLWRAQLASADSAGNPAAGAAAAHGPDPATGIERVRVRAKVRADLKRRHAVVGDRLAVRGKIKPTGARRKVVVKVGGLKKVTKAKRNGRFSVRWTAKRTGTDRVKVRAGSNRLASSARARAGRVTTYRRAAASWYGPGLYGNRMACGGTLTSSTLGVAHRTMRCGTKVRLRYGKRTVKVPVVDRGPFHGGREFDLTAATKRRLGFPDLGTVLSSR